MGREGGRHKVDERILGDSSFVLEVLRETEEQFERRYELKSRVEKDTVMILKRNFVLRPAKVPM